ncbi:hypothetical protein DWB77_00164 [Streptomyces hundungensis]|uniref:Uncharacterized protein n=1 Tax=Streptomyces hundungensis TaxID=1077946 RepID=A0A387HBB0_9ACTN|nr:hypothetical protein DWB77_00164 [Streptomyces hundungensis]
MPSSTAHFDLVVPSGMVQLSIRVRFHDDAPLKAVEVGASDGISLDSPWYRSHIVRPPIPVIRAVTLRIPAVRVAVTLAVRNPRILAVRLEQRGPASQTEAAPASRPRAKPASPLRVIINRRPPATGRRSSRGRLPNPPGKCLMLHQASSLRRDLAQRRAGNSVSARLP